MMTCVDEVEVVLANNDRVTLRVGDTFLKIDADVDRTEREAAAIELAPVPTPEILWRKPSVLALAGLRGEPIGRLGEPSTASPEAWAAVGSAIRSLHDAPLPPWPGKDVAALAAQLEHECEWLVANEVLPADVITSNQRRAEMVLRDWDPVFIHGDLHIAHVFVDEDDVTGIIDCRRRRRATPCSMSPASCCPTTITSTTSPPATATSIATWSMRGARSAA